MDISLNVQREENNRYDPNAMKVLMPPLDQIPERLHGDSTRPGGARFPIAQTVARIAGRQVGRVPANLCKAFNLLLQRDLLVGDIILLVGDIIATYTGDVGPSTRPPMDQHFGRSNWHGRHDRPGGGVDLACTYKMTVKRHHFREACAIFEEHVPRPDLERFRL